MPMKPNLKDLIRDNEVKFLEYRKGYLYYTVTDPTKIPSEIGKYTYNTYKFSVPISDTGDATFKNYDKAILFMRYIKKAIDEGTLVEI